MDHLYGTKIKSCFWTYQSLPTIPTKSHSGWWAGSAWELDSDLQPALGWGQLGDTGVGCPVSEDPGEENFCNCHFPRQPSPPPQTLSPTSPPTGRPGETSEWCARAPCDRREPRDRHGTQLQEPHAVSSWTDSSSVPWGLTWQLQNTFLSMSSPSCAGAELASSKWMRGWKEKDLALLPKIV